MAKTGRVEEKWHQSGKRHTYEYIGPCPPVNHATLTSNNNNVLVGKPIPPPLAVRYTWDSDDDSGIGHSRGGHGGSTSSSTEADTNVHDLNCSPPKPPKSDNWRWNPHTKTTTFGSPNHTRINSSISDSKRGQCQSEQKNKAFRNWTTVDSDESRRELVNAGLIAERVSCADGRIYCNEEQFRLYSNIALTKNAFQQPPHNIIMKSELSSPRLPLPSFQAVDNNKQQPLPSNLANHGRNSPLGGQLKKELLINGAGNVNEKSKKWDIRRVWSYSGGESNLLTTSYPKSFGDRSGRKTVGCNITSANNNNSNNSNPVVNNNNEMRRPSNELVNGNRERCTPHLASGLRGAGVNQKLNWANEGLSRNHSASLASLVTVDNVMIHAHACLAAVIPASEMGDTLSVIDVHATLDNDDDEERTYRTDSISSISPSLPPPPLPPWSRPIPPPQPQRPPPNINLYSNCHFQAARSQPPHNPLGNIYSNCQASLLAPDLPVDNRHLMQNNIRPITLDGEVNYAAVNKLPFASVSRATYATVNKLVSRKDSEQSLQHQRNPEMEETEPPLPPRNYRSELANKRLTSSKSSLSMKVNGLTRSAKQALRKAFSLEGLNCIADPHNETQEWDNADDWARILALSKPNTPSAVKARGAINRDKSNNQHQQQQQQMATLC